MCVCVHVCMRVCALCNKDLIIINYFSSSRSHCHEAFVFYFPPSFSLFLSYDSQRIRFIGMWVWSSSLGWDESRLFESRTTVIFRDFPFTSDSCSLRRVGDGYLDSLHTKLILIKFHDCLTS